MIELTPREWRKVTLKKIISIICAVFGGFWFSRLLARPMVTIIVYHRIICNNHPGVHPYISVTTANLRKQIRFFKKHYELISLEEAITLLESDSLEKQYLVLTFDDGYKDNYSLGLDIFTEEAVKPTVFITTECVARHVSLWPDRVRNVVYNAVISHPVALAKPDCILADSLQERINASKKLIAYCKVLSTDEREKFLLDLETRFGGKEESPPLMLDSQQVKLLSDCGVSIGSHTLNHPVLAQVPAEMAEHEIRESKRTLEEWTGRPIVTFAYPNGMCKDFTDSTIRQLKTAGYVAAVTTMRGVNKKGCDLFRLRRTGIYVTDSLPVVKMKLAVESLL